MYGEGVETSPRPCAADAAIIATLVESCLVFLRTSQVVACCTPPVRKGTWQHLAAMQEAPQSYTPVLCLVRNCSLKISPNVFPMLPPVPASSLQR